MTPDKIIGSLKKKKKISTPALIIPHIIWTIACIIQLVYRKIYFSAAYIKPAVYGMIWRSDELRVNEYGKSVQIPDISLVLKNFYMYEYINFLVVILFVIVCVLRYFLLKGSRRTFNNKLYLCLCCICTAAVALADIVI